MREGGVPATVTAVARPIRSDRVPGGAAREATGGFGGAGPPRAIGEGSYGHVPGGRQAVLAFDRGGHGEHWRGLGQGGEVRGRVQAGDAEHAEGEGPAEDVGAHRRATRCPAEGCTDGVVPAEAEATTAAEGGDAGETVDGTGWGEQWPRTAATVDEAEK